MGAMKERAIDEANRIRGKRNRNRGNAIEREICKALGITRVGMFGGKADGGKHDEWIAVQVKSGGAFSEKVWGLIQSVPYRGDQLRGLVVADAPGPGTRRRAYIAIALDEFIDWHGTATRGDDEQTG
jgi:hypothetical protein